MTNNLALTQIKNSDTSAKKNLPFWYFLLLALFSLIAFFYGLSSYPIVDMNEGLYAEVAREMLALKDYLIPHLNFVPYLEKPPLFYWLIALSYKAFGINTFAARLIPALSSLSVSLTLLGFSAKIKRLRSGWLSAMILASSLGYVIIGRVVFFDMLLTAMLTASLCLFYLWHVKEKSRFLWFAYVFLALAFLTKGILPVIIGALVAISFLFFTKTSRQKFLQFLNPVGISLFFLLTAPWYIAAMLKLPHFGWDYFVNEQLLRFLNQRTPHDYHTGPIYFYLPRIFVYLFPWSLGIPFLFKKWRGKIASQDPLKIFLWLWFLIPLIILSLSGAKGDYYMVLGMPPLAMLLALKIEDYFVRQKNSPFLILYIIIGVLLASAAGFIFWQHSLPQAMLPKFAITLGVLSLYFIVGLLFILRFKKPLLSFILLAGLIMPIFVFGISLEHDMQAEYNQLALTQYIKTHHPERPVYLFQDYETISTVLFNLQKRLPIIDSISQDLDFGSKTAAAKGWFINDQAFLKQIKNKQVYVVLLKKKRNAFDDLVGQKSFCSVATSSKAVVLSNSKDDCKGRF